MAAARGGTVSWREMVEWRRNVLRVATHFVADAMKRRCGAVDIGTKGGIDLNGIWRTCLNATARRIRNRHAGCD